MLRRFARYLLVVLLFALFAAAQAQEGAVPPAPEAPPAAAEAPAEPPEVLTPAPEAPTTPPLAPPPPEGPVVPAIPAPVPPLPAPGTRQLVIQAERNILSPTLGIYQFFGDVVLTTEQIEIHADELSYSTKTEVALARGNVSIRAENGVTYFGNVLEYNVRTRVWQFVDWSTAYPPEFLGPPFIAPVYVGGENITGFPRFLRATNTTVTTCELPNPDYYIRSSRVEIYPGDKLIAWDNDLYIYGHRVLHVPWFFLSLKQNRTPIVPEFGQNDVEGYFARFLYQYVINPDQLGGVRLDLTQKLGPAAGVDHFYTIPNGSGEAFLYSRYNLSETVARIDHQQQLPKDIALNLKADWRRDSLFNYSLVPTTATYVDARLQRPTPRTNTQLAYTRRLNESTYLTDNTSALLRYDNRSLAGNFQYSAEYGSYASIGSTFATPANQQLWNRLFWTRRLDVGNLNLRVDDLTQFGEGNFFSGIQRLPEVYLESSQDQLHLDFLDTVPSRFTIGWGRFAEMQQQTSVDMNRYRFEWQASPRKLQYGRTEFLPTLNFRQTVYGDPDTTAQYNYTLGFAANNRAGALTNSVRYALQHSRGFTPFRFDFIYPYHTITDTLQYTTPNLGAYLTGGRDLENGRWQDLTFRSQARLTPHFTTRQAFGYDLNNSLWRDLISRFDWQYENVILNLGTIYDLNESQLRNVSTELSWVISPQWRLQWMGGYDGFTKDFLYNEFLVTRDFHCWDASLYYSRQQSYFYLYVRLKALNLPLPRFGIGNGGQVLNPGLGDYSEY